MDMDNTSDMDSELTPISALSKEKKGGESISKLMKAGI